MILAHFITHVKNDRISSKVKVNEWDSSTMSSKDCLAPIKSTLSRNGQKYVSIENKIVVQIESDAYDFQIHEVTDISLY